MHTLKTLTSRRASHHASMSSCLFQHRIQNPCTYLTTAPASLQETRVEFSNHRGENLVGTLVDPPTTAQSAASAPPAATSGSPEAPPSSSTTNSSSSSNATAPLPPVVLLAHGYMSSRNSELLVRLATALARSSQLSSFRFDFSGNGESEGGFRYGQYR